MRLINDERPDLLVYPTYTTAPTAEERFAHLATLAYDPAVHLRSATVDPGAANFSWWDPKTNAIKGDNIFGVSHEHLAYFLLLSKANGIQYSVVVREPGHVRISVAMHRMGLMEGTILFKLNLGDHALWGIPPSEAAVDTYLDIVPDDIPYTWMSYTYGPSHWDIATPRDRARRARAGRSRRQPRRSRRLAAHERRARHANRRDGRRSRT